MNNIERRTGENLPNINQIQAFRFPAGHGLLLYIGTWHDFPIACDRSVVILTANSDEVVTALSQMQTPEEMNQGEVYKISLSKRLKIQIQLET
ncbi:hypothetical protein BMF81_02654 [Nodularia spumigena UHCC 0039]|jgi:ureidoglycolate lyase|uniref:Uncharacterized protein n=1 Tax=Nodularia spumigena UHCC 0039 TaxID=1914872 RepID=A0A2S0Q8J5_NODSP|nr:hypothetical protein BMF81_02654 [Nodularia spumigena UHCC 0039]